MDFLADTSYKQSQAEVIGSLTASAVATGSQLVGYSGFSNEAFIREPASTDLDFGTGEWSASAWVNVSTNSIILSYTLPTELLTNPELDGSTGWAADASYTFINGQIIGGGSYSAFSQHNKVVPGKTYELTINIVQNYGAIRPSNGTDVYLIIGGAGIQTARFTATRNSLLYFQTTSGNTIIESVSLKEVSVGSIASRSGSSGASFDLSVTPSGYLGIAVSDGTTTRTVASTAAYNTGTWLKVDTYYKTDGSLSIAVNGQQVATTGSQTPLLTLNNSNAVLTIGNNYSLTAPFPGSIALLKLSATVPTTEQLQWMYEQEKALFNANTLCALPDSSSILDLAYEDDANRLIAISQSNESYWTGLTRVVTEPVTTGGLLSKVAAASNVHLIARSTVDAGVDVTIPASNIKTMLERDRASETIQQITIFDYDPAVFSSASLSSTTPSIMTCAAANVANTPYVGMTITGTGITAGTTIVGIVTGTPNTYYLSSPFTGTTGTYTVSQTSFQLPIGYTTTAVYKNGTELRESISATKDWTRSFDGFKEVIILTTAPASNEWIQIHATKDN